MSTVKERAEAWAKENIRHAFTENVEILILLLENAYTAGYITALSDEIERLKAKGDAWAE